MRYAREGDDWCAVLYGVYPGFSKAEATPKALPPKLRRAQPWTREVGGLADHLRA